MRKIVFVRHPETVGNAEGREQGQRDTDLSRRGARQSIELVRALRTFDDIARIVSSDLSRAESAAELLAREVNLPVVKSEALREQSLGEWELLRQHEIVSAEPSYFDHNSPSAMDIAPPGGETRRQLYDRVVTEFSSLTQSAPRGTTIVFTHGGVIRAVIAYMLGTDRWPLVRLDNASLSGVEESELAGWRISYLNVDFRCLLTQRSL